MATNFAIGLVSVTGPPLSSKPLSSELLTFKAADPQKKLEQMATNMRKSKKQELLTKKRQLFGCNTPRERSISPMFESVHPRFKEEGKVDTDVTVGGNDINVV